MPSKNIFKATVGIDVMIKFFRNIRRRMLGENRFSKYLLYAIGEIVLVVIGILIALQINNWNGSRTSHNVATVLAESLVADYNRDKSLIEKAIQFSELKIENCDSLLESMSGPEENWNYELIYEQLAIVGQSHPFFPTDGTYNQVVTSGSLRLFDQQLANKMNGYAMQLKEVAYWVDVEDETLWRMADIAFKGIDLRALSDLRFHQQNEHALYLNIPTSEMGAFTNLVAYVKTCRKLSLKEYNEQLELANELIKELERAYRLDKEHADKQ